MQTAAVIVACFAGTFAFSFLLAAFLLLQDTDQLLDPNSHPRRNIAEILDALFSGGIIIGMSAVIRNWRSRTLARRFVYSGIASLLVMVAALYLM